jgi:hypothetical protein
MVENSIESITALWVRAGEAHHIYERDVLNGVYHTDWFGWYANFAVEHGIGALLGRDITVEELIAFLKRVSVEHKDSGTDEPWTSYYARALVEAS